MSSKGSALVLDVPDIDLSKAGRPQLDLDELHKSLQANQSSTDAKEPETFLSIIPDVKDLKKRDVVSKDGKVMKLFDIAVRAPPSQDLSDLSRVVQRFPDGAMQQAFTLHAGKAPKHDPSKRVKAESVPQGGQGMKRTREDVVVKAEK